LFAACIWTCGVLVQGNPLESDAGTNGTQFQIPILWSISFGYLMNLTIPRSGEVARATALYGVEKVPVDKSFGTIILERVVDLFCMMVFLGLTLLFK
jgi:hypothetical protein